MGVHPNVSAAIWPKQGEQLGRQVWVCFHYDSDTLFAATVVRYDTEPPWEAMLQLTDGRIVRATECQYRFRPTEIDFLLDAERARFNYQRTMAWTWASVSMFSIPRGEWKGRP